MYDAVHNGIEAHTIVGRKQTSGRRSIRSPRESRGAMNRTWTTLARQLPSPGTRLPPAPARASLPLLLLRALLLLLRALLLLLVAPCQTRRARTTRTGRRGRRNKSSNARAVPYLAQNAAASSSSATRPSPARRASAAAAPPSAPTAASPPARAPGERRCRVLRCVALLTRTARPRRFILADTDRLHRKIAEMSDRIRQLEDALAILQSSVTRDLHPLLVQDLLKIKSGLELHSAAHLQGRVAHSDDGGEQGDEESQYIDAFGTLAVRDDGAAMFYGRSAGSEVRLLPIISVVAQGLAEAHGDCWQGRRHWRMVFLLCLVLFSAQRPTLSRTFGCWAWFHSQSRPAP